jgi:AraC-like DNA-binding protein
METMRGKDFFDPDGPPLCVFRMPLHEFSRSVHGHDCYELMIIREGEATHGINGKEYVLLPGDVYLMRPGDEHEIIVSPSGAIAESNVLFDFDRLDLNLRDLATVPGFHTLFSLEPSMREATSFKARLRLNPEQLRKALDLIDELEYEQAKELAGYQLKCITLFLDLILFLSRAYEEVDRQKVTHVQRIAEAVSYIEANFAESVTLDELTQRAHCSATQLRRIFQEVYGVSPHEYLTRTRINRAMMMLRDSDRDVTSIALACGYNDSNYFTRSFRKSTGLTPTAYRKRQAG